VRRPDRSVLMERPLQNASTDTRLIAGRMPPGSFTLDPGMRAGDEFTDVTSPGYREHAKRVAERGGAMEYATSVEEEEGKEQADQIRELVLMALLATTMFGEATGANQVGRYIAERDAFFKGPYQTVTIGQRPPSPIHALSWPLPVRRRPGANTRGGGWQGVPDDWRRIQAGQTRTLTRQDLLDYLRKTYGGSGEIYPFPRMGN